MDRNEVTVVGYAMVGHAMVHALELSIPILMTHWLLEFSVSPADLGLVVAVGYGLFGLGALPAGVLVDRYGSRRLIVACLGGMGLSFVLLSRASGPITIAAALGCWGIAASVYHPAGLTLVSNAVNRRGVGLGYHGMAGNAGIAFGPLATIVALEVWDWRTVALALALPAIAGALLGLLIRFDETAAVGSVRRTPSILAGSRRIFTIGFVLVLAIVVSNGLYYRGILTFLPDLLEGFVTDLGWLEGQTVAVGHYLYAGLLTVGIGGQFIGGQVADRVRLEYAIGGLYVALAIIGVLFVPAARLGVGPLLAMSVALGFALFAMQPLVQSTVAAYTPAGARGLSFGYVYVATFGIGSAGAVLVGAALTYGPVAGAFLVVSVLALVGLGFVLTLWKYGDHSAEIEGDAAGY